MHSQSLQTVITLGVVALAAGWWLRRAWQGWFRSSPHNSCGGCHGCPQQAARSNTTETSGFVPLAALHIPPTPQPPHRSPPQATSA